MMDIDRCKVRLKAVITDVVDLIGEDSTINILEEIVRYLMHQKKANSVIDFSDEPGVLRSNVNSTSMSDSFRGVE